MQKSDADWKKELTPEQYRVLRQKGTEAPYSGALLDNKADGVYTCGACGAKLFDSSAKYDSTMPGLLGWPSFDDVVEGAIELVPDNSLSIARTEVICTTCGGHLGHLFDDSSSPNGKHYCINSVSLDFEKK